MVHPTITDFYLQNHWLFFSVVWHHCPCWWRRIYTWDRNIRRYRVISCIFCNLQDQDHLPKWISNACCHQGAMFSIGALFSRQVCCVHDWQGSRADHQLHFRYWTEALSRCSRWSVLTRILARLAILFTFSHQLCWNGVQPFLLLGSGNRCFPCHCFSLYWTGGQVLWACVRALSISGVWSCLWHHCLLHYVVFFRCLLSSDTMGSTEFEVPPLGTTVQFSGLCAQICHSGVMAIQLDDSVYLSPFERLPWNRSSRCLQSFQMACTWVFKRSSVTWENHQFFKMIWQFTFSQYKHCCFSVYTCCSANVV